MIHHASIPARDPRLVADVLAELLRAAHIPFPPYRVPTWQWAAMRTAR
jgi:hypothetical protein